MLRVPLFLSCVHYIIEGSFDLISRNFSRILLFMKTKLILKKILGVILVIIGIAALITPLTPGAWLGLIGLELLGWGFLIPEKLREKFRWKKKGNQ